MCLDTCVSVEKTAQSTPHQNVIAALQSEINTLRQENKDLQKKINQPESPPRANEQKDESHKKPPDSYWTTLSRFFHTHASPTETNAPGQEQQPVSYWTKFSSFFYTHASPTQTNAADTKLYEVIMKVIKENIYKLFVFVFAYIMNVCVLGIADMMYKIRCATQEQEVVVQQFHAMNEECENNEKCFFEKRTCSLAECLKQVDREKVSRLMTKHNIDEQKTEKVCEFIMCKLGTFCGFFCSVFVSILQSVLIFLKH